MITNMHGNLPSGRPPQCLGEVGALIIPLSKLGAEGLANLSMHLLRKGLSQNPNR